MPAVMSGVWNSLGRRRGVGRCRLLWREAAGNLHRKGADMRLQHHRRMVAGHVDDTNRTGVPPPHHQWIAEIRTPFRRAEERYGQRMTRWLVGVERLLAGDADL